MQEYSGDEIDMYILGYIKARFKWTVVVSSSKVY